MNIFALISLLSSGVSIFLGNFVLYQNPKSTLNRVFFICSLSLAYWSFTEFGYRQAETYETADFWLKTVSFWPFTIAFILHFILVFTEKSKLLKNSATYLFIYIPPPIVHRRQPIDIDPLTDEGCDEADLFPLGRCQHPFHGFIPGMQAQIECGPMQR